MSTSSPTSKTVLRLYKHLLKYGQQLKLTDKTFYRNRIREEFRINKSLTNPEEVAFNFKRGETLLKNGRII